MTSPTLDLEAYLQRVGYTGPRTPSRALLTALHEAHAGSVPFENLDILLGRPIRLDLESLQAKLVGGRRGGYCFEHNTLFQAVLEALGFRVTPLAARVRFGATKVLPRTHMLLLVDVAGSPFLADVGFGGDGLLHPLPLAAGPESWVAGDGYRLREEAGEWVLASAQTGGFTDLYAFTLEAQHPVDYEVANHYTGTFPASPFVQRLTAQRVWPGRRAILRDRELVVREGGKATTEAVRDPAHLLEVLDRVFGLAFPAGTRFSRPDF